jgi:glycosyltransferase involved in cell wall biosynthesis
MNEERVKLSVVVISKNEEKRIAECLASVAWADEIVVVDSGSTDATCEIARRHGATVHDIPWKGFGPQKQAAVELATHDWILNIDCDERVTDELGAELRTLLERTPGHPAYSVPRRTFLGDKEIRHGGWSPDRTLRLFDRKRARFSDDLVHEKVVVQGVSADCEHALLHYSFAGTGPLLAKLNQYTDLWAQQNYQAGKRCSALDLFIRPPVAFLKAFVVKAGFLDGADGLVVAVSNATNVFYKYAKLRELQNVARR